MPLGDCVQCRKCPNENDTEQVAILKIKISRDMVVHKCKQVASRDNDSS